ncbi:dihydroorotase [Brackiella oedipodis]|uniref:dihydroorotase n=1 Tax=Brackiella oedipodis TaxID=124225 RepID=UPI0004917B38|nr:dihydroorotase [Brackiella oedipodis]
MTTQQISIIKPDDWHLHLRDGQALQAVVADTCRQFARAIIMPNLQPPVTTVALAEQYRQRILQAMAHNGIAADSFEPLMTLYLTDNTPAAEIKAAAASGFIKAVKLYPAGATTNSDEGVTDLLKYCRQVLEALQAADMPLLVHGEVNDPNIDIFDREAVFIDRVMTPLRRDFPALKVVFEHITTADAADYVREAEGPVAATITPQHLLFNRNAIFNKGLQPHFYCLPVLKREKHRQALVRAATSGNPRFFLGTDSAPHAQNQKEKACGCAGCYSAHHALALYLQVFEQENSLQHFEAFASLNGPKFYGLPTNTETITLVRQDMQIPERLPYVEGQSLIPLAAKQTLNWSLQG